MLSFYFGGFMNTLMAMWSVGVFDDTKSNAPEWVYILLIIFAVLVAFFGLGLQIHEWMQKRKKSRS